MHCIIKVLGVKLTSQISPIIVKVLYRVQQYRQNDD